MMDRRKALEQLDEIINVFVSMATLTKGFSNSPEEVQDKIRRAYQLQEYIKEYLE